MILLIVIRADASQSIGSGHIMRCLTLAERLRQDADVIFVCRDLLGNLSEYIRSQGFEVYLLPRDEASDLELKRPEQVWIETTWKSDAEQTMSILKKCEKIIDWLIVDHYGIDHHWQSFLRGVVHHIMVIDDLANRHHDCDVLLDQNYYHNASDRYHGLIPKNCSLFLGPHYLLLREEFYRARKDMRIRTGEVSNILVFYGGADTTNETEKCITGLIDYTSSELEINVVTGQSNPNKEKIKDICSSTPNIYYHCQVTNIAELMNKADLAFGAGGSTTWERCFLGLPSIVTVTADNQMETTQAVSDLGAIWNLGWYEKVNNATLNEAAEKFLIDPSKIVDIQRKALEVVGVRDSSGIEQLVEVIFRGRVDSARRRKKVCNMDIPLSSIQIGDRRVGPECPPFIIAEMSGNHNQSLDTALEIVEGAAKAGVHALKIQTYTPDTMTLNIERGEFLIKDSKSLWKGNSLYQLYEQAYTPWEWHKTIFDRCKELGLICFSTPFDFTAVDFLESLGVPAYKIASFENTDIALIRKVAATGKPMLISTGMASIAELDETIKAAKVAGCKSIILLKCTSSYPATPENSNVRTIPHMQELFHCQVGLSDHTLGIGTAVASVALGATVIEKHFTLSREAGGVDSAFSMEPREMKGLVIESERAWLALGRVSYGPTFEEQKSLQFRRSLYVVEDIRKGDIFSDKNLRAIRPGLGLPPKYFDLLIGKEARRDIIKGTPTNWDML